MALICVAGFVAYMATGYPFHDDAFYMARFFALIILIIGATITLTIAFLASRKTEGHATNAVKWADLASGVFMTLIAVAVILPNLPRLFVDLGDEAAARYDNSAAARHYMSALKFPFLTPPEHFAFLRKAANAQYDYALETKEDSDLFTAYNLMRDLYTIQQRSERALQLSRLLLALGDYQNAQKALALARATDNGENALAATILDSQIRRNMNDVQGSLSVLSAAAKASPGKNLGREFHYNFGEMLMKVERFEDAAAQFNAALTAHPHDAQARIQLGCTMAAAGDTQGALKTIEDARKGLNVAPWTNDIDATKRYVAGVDKLITQLRERIKTQGPTGPGDKVDLCSNTLPPVFSVRYGSPLIHQLDTNFRPASP
jgi:tetratricopeptide (TPR) repeat protein